MQQDEQPERVGNLDTTSKVGDDECCMSEPVNPRGDTNVSVRLAAVY